MHDSVYYHFPDIFLSISDGHKCIQQLETNKS